MTLIKSISGIRGTIGGNTGENLTPLDIVKFTSAYGEWIKNQSTSENTKIVVGRDARISGEMCENLVISTLNALGIDVINLGLSTTPTVEVMVPKYKANGGIILTASHNPKEWNALKLLNAKGEFVSDKDGAKILEIAEEESFKYADVDHLGSQQFVTNAIEQHIEAILEIGSVDTNLIKNANFKVAIDCVNSTGGIAVPMLLKALGVQQIEELYCEPNGHFPHNPEPLPENLTEISSLIRSKKCDLGIVVDPDVDRLALVNEDGSMFGEEYTLVAVSDYILSKQKGITVSNLSSTIALRNITEDHGCQYFSSAVGEVNVVEKMKEQKAVIGGEGNGGIIFPELHYGRDALVGIALFLTHLAHKKMKMTELKAQYPNYHISKNKIQLTADTNVDAILEQLKEKYSKEEINTIDGVKIIFGNEWVHLRKSNTEPIIRVYSESISEERANELAEMIMNDAYSFTKTI
ncbi:MAG: phosphoglucosamine mutase [Crocinitomicaceae bacterium]